jgi:hypothetical protein
VVALASKGRTLSEALASAQVADGAAVGEAGEAGEAAGRRLVAAVAPDTLPGSASLMTRLDAVATDKTLWAQNCTGGGSLGANAAKRRMEHNALFFAGGKATGPRYKKLAAATGNFELFTLQNQLPVIDMQNRAAKYLLELFRTSGAAPASAPKNLREAVNAMIATIPSDKAPDFSDVLMFQYFLIVRGVSTVVDASTAIPGLPPCLRAAPLLDVAALLKFGSAPLADFATKIHPLMLPAGAPLQSKGLAPLLEYERGMSGTAEGEAIY